jgi:hypothetical protein
MASITTITTTTIIISVRDLIRPLLRHEFRPMQRPDGFAVPATRA